MEPSRRRPPSLAWGAVAWLVAAAAGADGPRLDVELASLEAVALAARPELAQAQAELRAAEERVPQAQAWSEPRLQVGLQHDGFARWQVGRSEMSWLLFMAEQTFPFPGKQRLRGEVASADVAARRFGLERVRLSTVADVRRAYLGARLAAARLQLVEQLEGLVAQAREVAQRRYEAGDGPQADVLRAQLELGRLGQRRALLRAEQALQRQALDRLRGQPAPLAQPAPALDALGFPEPPDEAAAVARALDASPELSAALAGVQGAEQLRALNQRLALPDLTVGVGFMVRGALEPMWSVTVGAPLPVFAATKQSRAVAEAQASADARRSGAEALTQLLRLRTVQRLTAWRALGEVWAAYRTQLRADADATLAATLEQLRVGKVPFTAVLDAAAVTVGLREASYGVLADAWRLAIAQDELSLADVSVGGASVGAAADGMGAAPTPTPTAPAAAAPGGM